MEEILSKYGIFSFTEKNGVIYVNQDVDISGKGLYDLPDIFSNMVINGNLSLTGNHFTTTKGFPKLITGDVNFGYNNFSNLEQFPEVHGSIILDSNPLYTLKGLGSIKSILSICNNFHLTSLSYAPIIENFDSNRLFCYDTGLHPMEIIIYKECLKLGSWDPTKTTYENARSSNISTKLIDDYSKINMKKFGL